MMRLASAVAGLALVWCACSSDKTPDSGVPPGVDAALDAEVAPDAELPSKDASLFVAHDAGGPIPCSISCDCPQGGACVNGECTALGTPVFCCEKIGCPKGQQCLDQNDQPDVCEGDPDPADAGPRVDSGPGQIGAYCEADQDCDPSMGLSCWERFEPPFVWGYCTLEDCAVVPCPQGADCIQFDDGVNPLVTGCMESCNTDVDCRTDAFCFPITGVSQVGVCIPDCRDDFFDCSPRDGSVYCNPATGMFIPSCDFTPTHDNSALIGDACINSTQCATGDICLGEIGWNLDNGMCSHVCDGLTEASPCPSGSTCQYLAKPNDAIGMCFRDCVGGACPDRAGATCSALPNTSWPTPSCVPPAP